MPRTRRLDVPGIAQHVVQRGNDRQPCFYREIDYLRYLQDLREAALKCACQVHAYVLMTNHVHLLVTPASVGAVGRMMQMVGRRYVRYLNDSMCRTGTLWEGRYKASLVDSERYLLACYRYIELNPVRAGMVESPAGYRWSSHAANGMGMHDPLVTPHEVYRRLADSDKQRRLAYQALFAEALSHEALAEIRLYVQRQRALGSSRFQAQIEQRLQQQAGLGRPSRPRNA